MSKSFKVDNPKAGSHKINLIGQRFGLLKVEIYNGLDKYKNKLWLCRCDCGNECNVTTTYLRNGKTTSCKCNQYKKGEKNDNFTGYKEISGAKWYSIEQNANIRALEFSITKEIVWDLINKQNNKCALTDLVISFKDNTASVDRIDNQKGYLVNNIHIVHKDINRIKSDLSLEYFKNLCKLVTIKNNICITK